MTLLPSLEQRTELNIDSLERAIVYSATLLKASYINSISPSKTDKRIQITHKSEGNNQGQIVIRAELAFDMVLALRSGGQTLYNLAKNEDVELLASNFSCLPSIPSTPEIPVISISAIDTLEKYFYLCCSLLKASLEETNKSIEISFLEDERTGGKAQVNAILPFDFKEWLKGDDYVSTVLRITQSYVEVGDTFKAAESQAFTFSNQSFLNNLSFIGN